MATVVEEVAAVRDGLGLDYVHVLGHSWGGWLALEYALGRPSGLASLLLASTCASLPAFAAETRGLKQSLPPGCRKSSTATRRREGYDGHTAPNRRIPIEPALVDVIERYLDTVGEDARQPGHPAGAVLPGRVRARCRGGITTIGGT
jgi:pimeloyl-ACP methyl ester carboxylesterase